MKMNPNNLPNGDFPAGLSQPALRALNNAGITSLEQLSRFPEKAIADLHGMGPKGIRMLREALADRGLAFAAKTRHPGE